MNSDEIRKRFLTFFEARGHKIIPSASLVPENDPSVLFNTAGMQPLVPYLLGEPHPAGKRLVDVQKCVRTQDIDEVGDNTHDTFFEMLGNWSLGDYFKDEAIKWSFELLTDKEKGFGLDPKRLYITVFEGDENAPRDNEAYDIWKRYMPEGRIYFMSAKTNWWSAGDSGPCGPDTEMFYDITEDGLGDMTKEEYMKADDEQKVVEIWNDVFMEYVKKDGKVVGKLENKNVDTGAGLERLAMVLQKKNNIFETDLFETLMPVVSPLAHDLKSRRIIADHIRTSVFMIADGVEPSNTDRGYVLRRILRRAVLKSQGKNLDTDNISVLVNAVIDKYGKIYPDLVNNGGTIKQIIQKELEKFSSTLDKGLKEFENGQDPFVLFTSYGFPFELTQELAKEKGIEINEDDFKNKFKDHQNLSRTGAEQKFKGGLANTNEQTVKLHTAHHLLLAALQEVLGKEVKQRGSNITEERLRMDFSFPRKLTPEELKKAEEIVNEHIKAGLSVTRRDIPLVEAETLGAEMEFGAKYPEIVSVYFIENKAGEVASKEFCGGPHATNTAELGNFKIIKEEAVSTGVRRIKAVLE